MLGTRAKERSNRAGLCCGSWALSMPLVGQGQRDAPSSSNRPDTEYYGDSGEKTVYLYHTPLERQLLPELCAKCKRWKTVG